MHAFKTLIKNYKKWVFNNFKFEQHFVRADKKNVNIQFLDEGHEKIHTSNNSARLDKISQTKFSLNHIWKTKD